MKRNNWGPLFCSILAVTTLMCSTSFASEMTDTNTINRTDNYISSENIASAGIKEDKNYGEYAQVSGRYLFSALCIDSSNIYSSYKSDKEIIGKVHSGDVITVIQNPLMIRNEKIVWMRVLINGTIGYVNEEAIGRSGNGYRTFAKMQANRKLAIPNKNVKIFSEKSTGSESIARASKGVAVQIVGESRWYYKTYVGEKFGYIVKSSCSVDEVSDYSLNENLVSSDQDSY